MHPIPVGVGIGIGIGIGFRLFDADSDTDTDPDARESWPAAKFVLVSSTEAHPLAPAIEETRAVLLDRSSPSWRPLVWCYVAGAAAACLGRMWFERTRPGFADVL